MIIKNPPSFILVDKATGEVVYTKRATGVGSEAIRKCAERGQALANKTGRTYFIYLDIAGARVGSKISVGMAYVMGITEEIYPGGRARSNPRGAVRRNIFTFNNPVSGPANSDAVRELVLYIENDGDLYRQQYIPIVKNLMLKRQKGVYDREKAVKLFMYLMDSGAKKYVREFSGPGNIDRVFNKNTRLAAARNFRDAFEGEADLGNWDHLLVKPTQRGLGASIARKAGSTEFEMDMGMFEKGYRYKLIPKSGKFYPLYAKSVYDVPKIMREYPNETFTTVDLSAPKSAHENPRRVRRNIFTFNNPKQRPLNEMEQAAAAAGLLVTTWAPGDGSTRYRFFKKTGSERYADYHQGKALYTAMGRKDAMSFIVAFRMGRNTRRNPLTQSEHDKIRDRDHHSIARSQEAAKQGKRYDEAYFSGMAHESRNIREKYRGAGVEYIPNPVCPNPCHLKHRHVRPNPLLQTVFMANPPISEQWDRMTSRQKQAAAEYAGLDEDLAYLNMRRSWKNLMPQVKRELEAAWLDTTSRGGTTRRRSAVAVNPLTRGESARILKRAKRNLDMASSFRPGHTRSEKSGQAFARGMVVKQYGPRDARRAAGKIITRAQKAVGTTLSNPGTLRLPKPGTKMTVAQAMELARRIGNKDLIVQCQKAMKLQKASDRNTKCVIWKTLPLGSPNKIDTVVAMTNYGTSPEDMYKPPTGSKKGPHMYRHKWKRSVPVLASPSGKAIIKVMGPGQKVGDWMRG